MRRILGNLLWEDDLAPRPTTPPRSVLETVSGLATLLRVFARDGDHLWTPSPVDPERVLEVPGVSRPILESGPLAALPPAEATLNWGATSPGHCRDAPRGTPWGVSGAATPADSSQTLRGRALQDLLWTLPMPSPAVAATVHHRAFCLQVAEQLGCALPGSQMVESLPSLDRLLAAAQAPPAWVLKAPLSASGRNRYIERAGPRISDPRSRKAVERLFEHHGPLLFEPWMSRTADFGVSALVAPSGLRIVGIHGQRVDIKGQFAGIDLQPVLSGAERDRLLKTAESVGTVLRREGYVGPFGIDAWRYRTESGEEILHPLGEINARMTFGLVAWAFAESVEGAVHLCFGRHLPKEEGEDIRVVPLLASGSAKGTAAWIATSPRPSSEAAQHAAPLAP